MRRVADLSSAVSGAVSTAIGLVGVLWLGRAVTSGLASALRVELAAAAAPLSTVAVMARAGR